MYYLDSALETRHDVDTQNAVTVTCFSHHNNQSTMAAAAAIK